MKISWVRQHKAVLWVVPWVLVSPSGKRIHSFLGITCLLSQCLTNRGRRVAYFRLAWATQILVLGERSRPEKQYDHIYLPLGSLHALLLSVTWLCIFILRREMLRGNSKGAETRYHTKTHTHKIIAFLPSHEYNPKAEVLSVLSTEAIDRIVSACRGPPPWNGTCQYDMDPWVTQRYPA